MVILSTWRLVELLPFHHNFRMSNDNIKNEIFVALCLCYREFFCDKKDGNFKWAETIKKTNLVELDEIHAKK